MDLVNWLLTIFIICYIPQVVIVVFLLVFGEITTKKAFIRGLIPFYFVVLLIKKYRELEDE